MNVWSSLFTTLAKYNASNTADAPIHGSTSHSTLPLVMNKTLEYLALGYFSCPTHNDDAGYFVPFKYFYLNDCFSLMRVFYGVE